MADNVAITAGSGTTMAADDIGGVYYQRVKLALGADGSGVDAVAGSGVNGTGVQRVTIATDDVTAAALVSVVKAEDAAHSSGDKGIMALSVRTDTAAATAGTDGDYQPLITDVNGRLHTIEYNAGLLVLAEDAAHSSGDKGVQLLSVRKDTAAATSGSDGDYQPIITDANGRLHTKDVSGVTLATLVLAEDAAHSSGDPGVQLLTVRSDTAAAKGGTDGDYQPLVTNSAGALHTADTNVVLLTKAEDAAHSSGDRGIMSLAVRVDAPAASAGSDGDYAPFQVDALGALRTVAATPKKVVSVTLTTTAGAYSALDQVGGKQTLTSAARASGLPVTLQSITVVSKSGIKPILTVTLFDSDPAAGTYADNDAPSLSTDVTKVIGKVSIVAADYDTVVTDGLTIATVKNLNIALLPSGSANLYAIATLTSGTPTLGSTSDLILKYGFDQGN